MIELVRTRMVMDDTTEAYGETVSDFTLAVEAFDHFVGRDFDREAFTALHMDARNKATAFEIVSTGTLVASLVHPREAFKAAIVNNAAAIIFIHNHPSGNAAPSSEDRSTCKRLKDAGSILGIEILDFIIVGPDTSFSFKQDNLL